MVTETHKTWIPNIIKEKLFRFVVVVDVKIIK